MINILIPFSHYLHIRTRVELKKKKLAVPEDYIQNWYYFDKFQKKNKEN